MHRKRCVHQRQFRDVVRGAPTWLHSIGCMREVDALLPHHQESLVRALVEWC